MVGVPVHTTYKRGCRNGVCSAWNTEEKVEVKLQPSTVEGGLQRRSNQILFSGPQRKDKSKSKSDYILLPPRGHLLEMELQVKE